MGTTAEKINRLTQTKSDLKTVINYTGANITDETTFKEYPKLLNKAYIDILNKGTNDLYEALPKTTGTGSNLTLNTEEGKMNITLKGDTQQNTSILPTGYTQVDYIESSGTQYIDTGVNADNNLRVVLDIAYTAPTTSNQNIGAIRIQSGNNARYHILSQSGVFNIYVNDNYYNTINSDTNRHLFDIKPSLGIATVDNQDFTIPSGIRDVNLNFWLFGRNSTSTKYYSKVKQWACKMYYNNVLVRDFIPCYRNSDNVVGLYDLVNNVFYTNQGTGAFTYGSVVNIPSSDYPQDINVVTGEQNIKIVGKNLFKPLPTTSNGITSIINEDGSISYSGIATATWSNITAHFYKKLELGTYTLSINKSLNYSLSIRLYFEDGTYQTVLINKGKLTTTFTITKKSSFYYAYIHTSLVVGEEYNDTIYIQLEKGSQATTYEPYQSQNYLVNLGNIELCKIGDYQDGIYYNSNWYYSNLFTKIESYNGETITTPYISTTGGLDIGATIYYYNSLNVPIQITDTTLTQQLDNLKNAKSYNEQTNITQTNNYLPFYLEVSALAKIE